MGTWRLSSWVCWCCLETHLCTYHWPITAQYSIMWPIKTPPILGMIKTSLFIRSQYHLSPVPVLHLQSWNTNNIILIQNLSQKLKLYRQEPSIYNFGIPTVLWSIDLTRFNWVIYKLYWCSSPGFIPQICFGHVLIQVEWVWVVTSMLISFNKIGNIPIQIALAFKQLYNKFTPNNISVVIGTILKIYYQISFNLWT